MSEIPGYREAIAREEEYRDLSFIESASPDLWRGC